MSHLHLYCFVFFIIINNYKYNCNSGYILADYIIFSMGGGLFRLLFRDTV